MSETRKLHGGLTPKRAKLVKAIKEQIRTTGKINLQQAGLQAFDTTDPKTAGISAGRALASAVVQDELQEVLERQGLSLNTIVKEIKSIAVHEPEKITAQSKLAALTMLLKISGHDNSKKASLNQQNFTINLNFTEAKEALGKRNVELDGFLKEADIELPTT